MTNEPSEPRHAGETREFRLVGDEYRPKRFAAGETPDPEPRAGISTVPVRPTPRHDTTGVNAIPAADLTTPPQLPVAHRPVPWYERMHPRAQILIAIPLTIVAVALIAAGFAWVFSKAGWFV